MSVDGLMQNNNIVKNGTASRITLFVSGLPAYRQIYASRDFSVRMALHLPDTSRIVKNTVISLKRLKNEIKSK